MEYQKFLLPRKTDTLYRIAHRTYPSRSSEVMLVWPWKFTRVEHVQRRSLHQRLYGAMKLFIPERDLFSVGIVGRLFSESLIWTFIIKSFMLTVQCEQLHCAYMPLQYTSGLIVVKIDRLYFNILIFFLFLLKHKDWGDSLDSPHGGGSHESTGILCFEQQ